MRAFENVSTSEFQLLFALYEEQTSLLCTFGASTDLALDTRVSETCPLSHRSVVPFERYGDAFGSRA